ncbi:MAG: RNA methyltransferase [Coprobacillus sp.]|nr:RNA methyltransferase [Coprobacillus sp.]
MKEITSVNNPLIKELIKLKQKKYRDKEKKFIVEGYNIIEEAKDYITLIITSSKEDENILPNVEHILVPKEIIGKLSETVTPQGIIGICNYVTSRENFEGNVLVLDGLQDPGNIGTLIRTAICFDFNTIYITDNSCDIYNEKVLRATQGGIFNVNIIRKNINDIIDDLKKKGYYIVGTSLKNGIPLNDINFKNLNAIILGNEGNGVSKETIERSNINAYIPINTSMESLNVAIAGGIIMNKVRN